MKRKLWLAELTICSGFADTSQRKQNRYADLAAQATKNGYHTEVLPVQVGSRGVIQDGSLESVSPTDTTESLAAVPYQSGSDYNRGVTPYGIWCDHNCMNF